MRRPRRACVRHHLHGRRAHAGRLTNHAATLVAAAGAGLIGSGVFRTDPVSGYPPGTPLQLIPPSRTGTVHTLFAIPIFFGIPAAALLSAGSSLRAGHPVWAAYSSCTAVVSPTAVALAGQGFAQKPSLVASGGSSGSRSPAGSPGSPRCTSPRPPPTRATNAQAWRGTVAPEIPSFATLDPGLRREWGFARA